MSGHARCMTVDGVVGSRLCGLSACVPASVGDLMGVQMCVHDLVAAKSLYASCHFLQQEKGRMPPHEIHLHSPKDKSFASLLTILFMDFSTDKVIEEA